MPESYQAVAVKIEEVSERVRRLHLHMEGKPLTFKPGQFVMADLTKPDGTPHKRAYSIASAPHMGDPLELVVKYEEGGVASEFFFKVLKEGGSFPARAPFGAFVIKEPVPESLAFVGTGTGVAPLRSMIHALYHDGLGPTRKVWLFLGVRYETEILYDAEWKKLAAEHPGFTYIPTISRPQPDWKGEKGYVQEKVKAFLPFIPGMKAYACGGDAMMKDLGAALVEKGHPKEMLHYEIW